VRRAGWLALGCCLAGCAPMSHDDYSKYVDSLSLASQSVDAAIRKLQEERFACHDGALGFLATTPTRDPAKSCSRDGSTLAIACHQFVMIEYDAATRAVRRVSETQSCATL
jgi:hypothetical protein